MPNITRSFAIQRKGNKDGKRLLATINTKAMDRYDTVILPEGANLENYRSNPIVLFNHNSNEIVGKSRVYFRNGELQAEMDEADFADTPKGREVRSLVLGGFINAVSIRFLPTKAEEKLIDPFGDANDWRNRYTEYQEWELLEWSFVSVPGNPEAIIHERNSNDGLERKLDEIIFLLKRDSLSPSDSANLDSESDSEEAAAETAPPDSEEAAEPTAEREAEEAPEETARKFNLAEFLSIVEEQAHEKRKRELGRA